MKKLFLLLLIIFSTMAWSQNNKYDFELVHTFKKGRNPGDIFTTNITPLNPASFYFDNEGNLYLSDSKFRRIVKYREFT